MSNREDDLVREGWTKRTTYDEPRLSEMVDLYKELGFEVLLEPFNPDAEPGCAECLRAAPQQYWTIYTRQGAPS